MEPALEQVRPTCFRLRVRMPGAARGHAMLLLSRRLDCHTNKGFVLGVIAAYIAVPAHWIWIFAQMLALFFEVLPKPGHEEHYFHHVGMLKPILDEHPGMTWLDRFKSMTQERLILSHQLWEDDAAIVRWRNDEQHKGSQWAGRYRHFENYRIRIAEVFLQVEQGGLVKQLDPGAGATGSYIVAGHSQAKPLEGFDENFASVNVDGAYVGLSSVAKEADASRLVTQMTSDTSMRWGFAAQIVRDYGMYERDQAPQDYPPVDAG